MSDIVYYEWFRRKFVLNAYQEFLRDRIRNIACFMIDEKNYKEMNEVADNLKIE